MMDDLLEYLLYGLLFILVLLVLSLLFILGEALCSNKVPFTGVVLHKSYSPEHSSTGIGTGITSNGSVGTITTYNYESEKFQLIVKADKNIITTDCSPEVFFNVNNSDSVNGVLYVGPLTKIRYLSKTLSKKGTHP